MTPMIPTTNPYEYDLDISQRIPPQLDDPNFALWLRQRPAILDTVRRDFAWQRVTCLCDSCQAGNTHHPMILFVLINFHCPCGNTIEGNGVLDWPHFRCSCGREHNLHIYC